METALKILILEDNPHDEELVRRALSKAGLSFTARAARTQRDFEGSLKDFAPDIVLLDYAVPGFGGLLGLKTVQEKLPEVPCVIVSGSLDEETAAGCIKSGAVDYVLKNNLHRLPPAIRGALEKSRITREHRLVQERLAKINACFLSFGADSVENINRLTGLCGEIMEAESAVYNRVDPKLVSAVGQWRLPSDFNPIGKPEGRICPKVLADGQSRLFVVRDLPNGTEAQSPEARHGFLTYVAHAVMNDGAPVGALCALYRRDFVPSGSHERAMGIVAAAIGVEEQRLRAEKERESLSDELRQSHKMEAIGRLAGGVAHDFNNALTAIKGHCEFLLLDHTQPDQERDDLLQINKAADYAASLTRQLLAFSRRQILSPKIVNLNETVKDVSKLLHRTLGENVRLSTLLAEGLNPVRVDPGQLEQILMNLAINARDAMPEGGRLTIETGAAERMVFLRVVDTGIGMDAETLKHIFEPFFTTKEIGKGTGLGLPTVYGIVKQSGGEVDVVSAPGQGTAFTVSLPAAAGEHSSVVPGADDPESLQGDETILLVEDEPTVRALMSRILRRNGYTVIEAADAVKALEVSVGHVGAIPLVVTDLVMPGLNGRQLADRLVQQRPTLKVLYISGYADETVVRHGLLDPGTEMLQKPFTPMALSHKVRQMLDA